MVPHAADVVKSIVFFARLATVSRVEGPGFLRRGGGTRFEGGGPRRCCEDPRFNDREDGGRLDRGSSS